MALRLRRLEDGEVLRRVPGEAAVIAALVTIVLLALVGAFVVGVAVGAALVWAFWAISEYAREDLKSMEG